MSSVDVDVDACWQWFVTPSLAWKVLMPFCFVFLSRFLSSFDSFSQNLILIHPVCLQRRRVGYSGANHPMYFYIYILSSHLTSNDMTPWFHFLLHVHVFDAFLHTYLSLSACVVLCCLMGGDDLHYIYCYLSIYERLDGCIKCLTLTLTLTLTFALPCPTMIR